MEIYLISPYGNDYKCFYLVFVFAYFTNILEIINGIKIVNIADAQVEGTIFIIWNVLL